MNKRKSLRQLAEELGVSHSYLSQVMHGKRPASGKVEEALKMVSMVSKNRSQQRTENPRVNSSILFLGTTVWCHCWCQRTPLVPFIAFAAGSISLSFAAASSCIP
jgi:hypothetical protein